jgi:hypothetical protein
MVIGRQIGQAAGDQPLPTQVIQPDRHAFIA